ncbi:uncharacterized protein LOC109595451 isoform X2 [Aethina tumida]|nr:uncharacterized protein LOC109595451 isoform X2 [Aethina tumida]XP_049826839.1 uncharacterized protein LOC109595451 isoform X2 [Aethina tumida]
MEDKEAMAEPCSSSLRKKRPERQLYVPPAQRHSRLSKEESPPKSSKKCEVKVQIHSDRSAHRKTQSEVQPPVILENIIPLGHLLHLHNTTILFPTWKYSCDKFYLDHDCAFYNYRLFGDKRQAFWTIPIYYPPCCTGDLLQVLSRDTFLWQPKIQLQNPKNIQCANTMTYPIYNLSPQNDLECDNGKKSILFTHFEANSINLEEDKCSAFKVSCPNVTSDRIIDLSVFNLPHCFLIKDASDTEYCFLCEDHHNIDTCYTTKKLSLLEMNEPKQNGDTPKSNYHQSQHVLEISKTKTTDIIRNSINTNKEKISPEKKIPKVLNKKQEHDQEKEIMRKTKENINRKSKPIMKYVDDNNDTLKIGKTDNVNNWEDLFDDEGQLQDELFTEISQKVGNNVTILKATEDYTAYTTKPIEEFEHVVELYDFPSTIETHDIIQMFSVINSDAMYIKWVDDTHALLVLGSLSQAQKAIQLDNPLIKARPMSAASGISLAVAYKSDLKPAMKRPQTNLQTARRLITSHLGAKTKISKEQNAKEREDLKAAREMKRLARQNERDAWDGFCKTSH